MIEKSSFNKKYSIEFLFLSHKLKRCGAPKFISMAIFLLFVILSALTIWSVTTKVDELATAQGEVLPASKIHKVQHLEGGIIANVFVSDGDVVEKGAELFELMRDTPEADLKRLKKRENSLHIDIFRLKAQLDRKEIQKDDLYDVVMYKGITKSDVQERQIEHAYSLYKKQMQELGHNKDQLALRLEQEKLNLENINKQIFHLKKRQNVLEDQYNMYSELSKQKASSKINLLNTQDRLEEVTGNLLEVIRQETTVKTTILDLENQLKLAEFNQDSLYLEEINDLTSELLEVNEQIARAEDRVKRLVSVAPVKGIVKGLLLNPGNVIAPAEELFEIVPITDILIAEVRVSTEDIGHIKKGDPVKVKVSTYDFSTYGLIDGTVSFISASTFLDEKNQPYYLARVTLSKNYLGSNPNMNNIFPGMRVTADIKTKQRSVMAYLLKPINRTFTSAFSER